MAFPFSRKFRAAHPRFTRVSLIVVAFLAAFGSGWAFASWSLVCRAGRCPSAQVLDDYQPRQTSKLYAADGSFIAELGMERRTLVTIADIPPVVRDAFLTIEDKRFYRHAGIDWRAVPRALLANLRAGSSAQGFSTITMQLARNIFPERISREKTLIRKLKEARLARDIEARYGKDRILELYLNQIYFGSGAHGVETAAQRYFGKSVRELNLAEAATLAALPKSPTRYDPRRFPDRAIQRRNTIIEVMRREGVVSDADASLAKAYPLRLAGRTRTGETAPYFVEWVRQILDDQFGRQLYEQGLRVYTTLDPDMQASAERVVERQLRAIEAGRYGAYRHQSYEAYLANATGDDNRNRANAPYLQAAFVALDPRTGAVRALVGGRDFDDSKFNRAVQSLRQPGSTFKPFVYAAAVQNGRPISYPLDDSPLAVPMADGSNWTPQNYDNRFEGTTPARRALYLSRNIPTIRLGMEIGEQTVVDMARKFGITTPIPPYPSIHLGAAEVYPLELVAAYSAFANLGSRVTPFAIRRVENSKGEVLWEPQPALVPVMSAEEAWIMTDALRDVVRRGTAAGSVGSVTRGIPAGGKTGTTNDGTDVWFVGFTADLVAGVWMGFDRPQRIKSNAQGGVLAAPAWAAFVNEVYRRRPRPPEWPRPGGIVFREVDRGTGELATSYCPRQDVYAEYFIPGTEPMRECHLHNAYTPYIDTTGGVYGPPAPGYPLPPDTARRTVPGTPSPAPIPAPGTVSPGAIPPPRPTRVDTPRTIRDTARSRPRAPGDTSNPFYIPPNPRPGQPQR